LGNSLVDNAVLLAGDSPDRSLVGIVGVDAGVRAHNGGVTAIVPVSIPALMRMSSVSRLSGPVAGPVTGPVTGPVPRPLVAISAISIPRSMGVRVSSAVMRVGVGSAVEAIPVSPGTIPSVTVAVMADTVTVVATVVASVVGAAVRLRSGSTADESESGTHFAGERGKSCGVRVCLNCLQIER
jgi:hypothetical protein